MSFRIERSDQVGGCSAYLIYEVMALAVMVMVVEAEIR